MLRPLAALFVFSGCQLVLGLDEVPDPGPARIEVTGSFVVREVMNDEAFNPRVVEHLAPASELRFDAILDDGTESPVAYDESNGTFAFEVAHAGQAYRLMYRAYDVEGELQHDAPVLALGYTAAGHLDRRPIQIANVQFSYGGTYAAEVASTGLYSQSDTGMTGPVVNFDWRLASPASGGVIGLLDEDHHDVLYALQRELVPAAANVPAWFRVGAVSSRSVTQVAATTAELTPPAPMPPNACVHLTTTGASDAVRISSAQPRSYTASYGDWFAFAVPSPELSGLAGALYPAYSGFVTAQDLDISAPFLNPFPGTSLIAESGTSQELIVQLLGAGSAKQYNTTRVYDIAASDCSTATALPSTVGLPIGYALGGTKLDNDNTSVTVDRSAPALLTWDIADASPVDYAAVQLLELTSIGGQTSFIPRWIATVPRAEAMIDPTLLEADHTYIFVVQTALGRPNIATGDFRSMTFPVETATIWTHTFVVH